jgi:hypothetical protein
VTGTPAPTIAIQIRPDGAVVDGKLLSPSAEKEWDQAVLDGIRKTKIIPLPKIPAGKKLSNPHTMKVNFPLGWFSFTNKATGPAVTTKKSTYKIFVETTVFWDAPDSTLAWVMGHEIGHLVNDHPGNVPNAQRRKYELEADEVGAVLAQKIGYDRANFFQWLHNAKAENIKNSDSDPSHPEPIDRVNNLKRKTGFELAAVKYIDSMVQQFQNGLAEGTNPINEGPFVQRIMHPGKVSIYVRSGKVPKLIATDIPYEILDRYIAKVIAKYPQFKPSDFSFRSSDKVSENQGWAATYEALKPDAFAALQQAKQRNAQNRQQEVDQWAQDFQANSSKLAGRQLKQRLAAPPPAPIPVARPGEGFYALKDRLAQLDIAKQKFEEFNRLIASIKKKYPLVADTLDQLENSLLQDVKDGAADNYASLLTKLSKYETALTTRFPSIVKEDPDYIDEASRT